MRLFPLLASTVVSVIGTLHAESSANEGFFPYVKGRYWLYDGTVEFVRDQQRVKKKITGWRSEVRDTVETAEFKAALLKGGPEDLAWYEDGRKPGTSIVILTRDGEFHHLHGREGDAVSFELLKTTRKLPPAFKDGGDLLLKTTMKVDDRFGDPEQTKLGPRYCWVVSNISTEALSPKVKGIPADRKYTCHTLHFQTNPDHTWLCFAAGLGVTYYQYTHHGTAGNCEMHLVETGDSKPSP